MVQTTWQAEEIWLVRLCYIYLADTQIEGMFPVNLLRAKIWLFGAFPNRTLSYTHS